MRTPMLTTSPAALRCSHVAPASLLTTLSLSALKQLIEWPYHYCLRIIRITIYHTLSIVQ